MLTDSNYRILGTGTSSYIFDWLQTAIGRVSDIYRAYLITCGEFSRLRKKLYRPPRVFTDAVQRLRWTSIFVWVGFFVAASIAMVIEVYGLTQADTPDPCSTDICSQHNMVVGKPWSS